MESSQCLQTKTQINRMRFTTIVALRIIKTAIAPLTGEDRTNVLILDDSLFERSRSKKVELLAKTYDHAKHSFCFSFRIHKQVIRCALPFIHNE